MVKLTRIYTRTGDDGTTGLGDGSRRSKTDIRIETYGTVDEANSSIGAAIALCATTGLTGHATDIPGMLTTIQHDMFDLGADLCTPVRPDEQPGSHLRIIPTQTRRLEQLIDLHNERLGPLTSFVLPGGTPLAAALHVARTVVRRAERLAVHLSQAEAGLVNPETVKYLNRLSDLLFVLGRVANGDGAADVLWQPGATRRREGEDGPHV
ncbi:MAG: cob(I)yrinic acid a,c-diamide adenosyltransferase [Phycisphaeraceae bacterium]|nr:cob(I)yrinic acid a,c-diamide adenosyltransferase [Phycisphaeraceae bacterium]